MTPEAPSSAIDECKSKKIEFNNHISQMNYDHSAASCFSIVFIINYIN